ncbi:MAG: DUF5667 domain-containing protein [Candidatus Dormibacteraeota bacterium]|nr:DUF5667 domain-containing protein [Candidatus Dormibacteraeota bacterium]
MTPEVQRLERLAERLRAVEPYVPPPGAKIRGWNLVLAAVEQSATARSRSHPLGRLVIGAAAAVVLLVAGALAASADSLPDSTLYPLKGVLENARGALTFGTADKLTYHLDLARTRLTEAETMIARHRVDLAGTSLQALDDQLKSAALLVQTVRQVDPTVAVRLQDRLRQAVATDDRQLADLQGQVQTPAAAGAIMQARAHAADALKLAEAPVASPTSSPSPGASPSPSPSPSLTSPTATP